MFKTIRNVKELLTTAELQVPQKAESRRYIEYQSDRTEEFNLWSDH